MRWLVRIAGSLLLLALLAVAALFLIPTETVARLAAAEFRKVTGRELIFQGAVRPSVWPELGVRTGAVTLANAGWSEAGPMLTAEGLSIALDTGALLRGSVRVTAISLDAPVLLLERAEDGRVNWSFDAAGGAAGATTADPGAGAGSSQPFTIDEAVVTGGRVIFADRATGTETRLDAVDLSLRVPDGAGAAELSLTAGFAGQAVSLAGSVEGFGAFLEGRVVPAVLKGTAGGARIGFDGRLGLSPVAAEGAVDADLSDLPALFALLGRPAPDLPEGLGRRIIRAAGALTLTAEGGAYLREGTVTLDEHRLTGAFDLIPGDARPKLTARLSAGALAFGAAAASGGSGGGSGGSGGSAPEGWSTAPIDASGLRAIDAEVALSAASVQAGPLRMAPAALRISLDAGRAVIDLDEVGGYGGRLGGQAVVNARDGLSARANLTLSGLALQPLLTDLAGTGRLSGTGDIRVNLLGSGGSVDALMRSLSGEGSLAFRDGAVGGFDLERLIGTLGQDGGGDNASTVFQTLTAGFTVDAGVLVNDDLALLAPLFTAKGSGQVDIGGRTIDYRLVPLSLRGNDLDIDAQVPVRISGPWAAPRIGLDLESVARRRLEEEAGRLEERARSEVEERLREELGVTAEEGEDLEDTARRAAEEALQNEAERALNRLLGIEE